LRGRNFVEQMAALFEQLGFPRMPGRILFAIMTAEEQGLTAAELAQRLGVSPAAISGAVRYLLQIGMLEREPVVGSRRDRYRLPDEGWYTVSLAKGDQYRRIAEIADKGSHELGLDTPEGARAAQMREFFLFCADELEGVMARWRSKHPEHR
jgi:DNA-binding transcriptional regulator GbsR (MarR family)